MDPKLYQGKTDQQNKLTLPQIPTFLIYTPVTHLSPSFYTANLSFSCSYMSEYTGQSLSDSEIITFFEEKYKKGLNFYGQIGAKEVAFALYIY